MTTIDNVENVETPKRAGRPAKKITSKKETEIEKLQRQVEELMKQVQNMTTSVSKENISVNSDIDDDDRDIVISSDDYIKVMSMLPYTLNLTTEPKGRGKLFTFEAFGEVKRILYYDLVHIIENHPSFVKNGYFVILDPRVIRRHGLDDAYESILNKEKIEKILSGNLSDAVKLFKSANKKQQETICQMIVQGGVEGKKYDLNLLDRLSRAYQEEGYSLVDRIKEGKKYLEFLGVHKDKKEKKEEVEEEEE
jgi:hypothetical protein